jgi:hypothetical protein
MTGYLHQQQLTTPGAMDTIPEYLMVFCNDAIAAESADESDSEPPIETNEGRFHARPIKRPNQKRYDVILKDLQK